MPGWWPNRRKHVFGWWDFDSKTATIINRVTGQRITEHSRDQDNYRRFTYSDSETSYDVHARLLSPSIHSFQRWTFDYNTSCDLQPDHEWHVDGRPSYGLWKRLDESLCDAFTAWPSAERKALPSAAFDLIGGWLNGTWQTDWARTWRCEPLKLHELPKRADIFFTPVPLRASPPPRWRYVHSPVAEPNPDIPGLSIEKGFKVELPDNPDGIRVGGRMPHLLREDGKAAIVPLSMRGGITYGEMYAITVHILYADDELACLFHHSEFLRSVDIMNQRISYRKARPQKNLLPVLKPFKMKFKTPDARGNRISKGITKLMSYETWRRLDTALIDGFSCWNPLHKVTIPASEAERRAWAEARQSAELPSAEKAGFDLDQLKNICLRGRYLGGVPSSGNVICTFRWTTANDQLS